jgi:hypothetical protein
MTRGSGGRGARGLAPHLGGIEPLAGDERVIQVRRAARGGENPLAGPYFATSASSMGAKRPGWPSRPPGSRRSACTSGSGATPWSAVKMTSVCRRPTSASTRARRSPISPVGAHRDVAHLRAVGTVGVAHAVVGRVADREHVGHAALAEPLVDEGRLGEPRQQLVAERAAVHAPYSAGPGSLGIVRPAPDAGSRNVHVLPAYWSAGRAALYSATHAGSSWR